jgi:hypothetical protein
MHECPHCKSERIHSSRTRSKWEEWRKKITDKRPFRCRACGWRGWGVDQGPTFEKHAVELATRALTPEPPNLKATGLARDDLRQKPLHLEELDVLAQLPDRPPDDRDPE